MLKIERNHKSESMLNKTQESTWDKKRESSLRISIFGLTLFQKKETLVVDYETTEGKKLGFKQ